MYLTVPIFRKIAYNVASNLKTGKIQKILLIKKINLSINENMKYSHTESLMFMEPPETNLEWKLTICSTFRLRLNNYV